MTASGYKPLNKNTLVGVFDLTLDSGIVLYGMMLVNHSSAKADSVNERLKVA